jgi:co-chaperonin GroES (HSP10)
MTGHVLNGKLLVRQDKVEEKTESGIIMPSALMPPPNKGTVVLTGEDTSKEKMQIQEGDVVFWADHAGTQLSLPKGELSLEGDYVLLDQQNVLYYKR